MAKAHTSCAITTDPANYKLEPDPNGEYPCLAMNTEATAKCHHKWHRQEHRNRICPACRAMGMEHVNSTINNNNKSRMAKA